jgi:hypothetical protein
MDQRSELWDLYEAILPEWISWHEDFRQQLTADDDACRFEQKEFTRDSTAYWKSEARLVALSAYRLVLEDGPEVADSESSSEEHGEEPTGM